MQKIFYLHVPLAIVALCGFVFGGIMAIQHLRTRDARYDLRSYVAIHLSLDPRRRRAAHRLDLGQGELGALVGVGRADARLVPDRLPALRDLPAAALLDRGPRAAGALRRVFAITAGAFVPLNFMAVRLAPGLTHPRVFATTDGGLPAEMRCRFYLCLIGMALLFVTLWKYEMASKHTSAQLRSLRRKLGGDDAAARRRRARAAPSLRTSRDRRAARQHRLRRRGLPRLLRAGPDLRRRSWPPSWRASSASCPSSTELADARIAEPSATREAVGTLMRAARPRHLAQDRAGRAARAPGADRARRPGASCASSSRATRSTRPSRSRRATAPRSTSSSATRCAPRPSCSASSPAAAGIRPTELAPVVYSPRNCDAARQLFRVTARPGLDDRRRGRGPGPGPPRLRGRARGAARPGR